MRHFPLLISHGLMKLKETDKIKRKETGIIVIYTIAQLLKISHVFIDQYLCVAVTKSKFI